MDGRYPGRLEMSGGGASQPFDLASLDNVRTIELAPAIFENNLAALSSVSPAVARTIEDSAIPAHWLPALGLDDAPTFRIEQPGQPAQWLGNTAAPRTRAAALLNLQRIGNVNIVLPGVAAGAELAWMMQMLPPHQAVFVAETDATRVAAILRLYDFAQPLRNGQVHFLIGTDIEPIVVEILARLPGLLAPSLIINVPDVSAARIESLRSQCERATRASAETRAARLTSLAASTAVALNDGAQSDAADSTHPRLGILALTPDRRVWRLAGQLVAAARELGWPAETFNMDSPNRVHPLAQAEWLAALRPTRLILCDTPSDKVALKTAAKVFGLSYTPDGCRDAAGFDRHLALSPRHESALRAAGVSPSRIVDFPWSVAAIPASSSTASPTIDVLFLGDRPSLDPAQNGIEQTTHVLLWTALQKAALAKWCEKESAKPEALLRDAERMIGFELPDESVRRRFLVLIERVLVPATVFCELAKLANQAGLRCAAVGNGWRNDVEAQPSPTFATIADAAAAGVIPRLAVTTLLPDGLRQDGVDAMAHGFPLAVHIPPSVRLSDYLAADFANAQCFANLSSLTDWRTLFQALDKRSETLRRQAETASRVALTNYRWTKLLTTLMR